MILFPPITLSHYHTHAHRLFPDFDYIWLTKEMNRNLPLELNFQCERGNIERTTNLLRDFIKRGEVAVPSVNAALSGRRVLSMSFEEGCYITNSRQISEWGLSRAQIGRTVAGVFCEQIFRHGFVHCGMLREVLSYALLSKSRFGGSNVLASLR